jgi:Tol biopolymer transport system component
MNRILITGLLCLAAGVVRAQDFNNIEYLCCDWGPAMTLPTKTNEAAQFNDAEEEVYFLKQVSSFTRKKRLVSDLFSSRNYQDIGKGLSIYLCKMKPDGSGKAEIKELWKNPNYPIDTQGQSTWMDVNVKTRKIALSITFAGSDLTGLWTMNLDGSELKRIITPTTIEGGLQAIDCSSWTPDGQEIVFGESIRGGKENWGRISRCDRTGNNLVRLSNGPVDCQPHVSPGGKTIAYIHWVQAASRLYVMGIDGADQKPLPNPDDKRWHTHGGSYPAWSPDAKRIFYMGISCCIIDAESGGKLVQQLGLCGWPHWGRQGLIGFNVGGILITDIVLKESKWLASSGLANVPDRNRSDGKW